MRREVGGRENTLVLRHYYADIYLDSAKTFRARVGQSEVPTGFEALQSSSRRAPFDRADAMESSAPGEQDLGVFFFWTPADARRRIRDVASPELKGTGDYGVVAVGVYNGQGGNRAEMNDTPHVIARVAYPFRVGSRYLEANGYAYGARIRSRHHSALPALAETTTSPTSALAHRWCYFRNRSAPRRNGRRDEVRSTMHRRNAITEQHLTGGYGLVSYEWQGPGERRVVAYARAQYFQGAFKTDPDARSSVVHEYEPGIEWNVSDRIRADRRLCHLGPTIPGQCDA